MMFVIDSTKVALASDSLMSYLKPGAKIFVLAGEN